MGGVRRWSLGAAMLTLAACGKDDDAGGPYAARVRENIPKIERATGLEFKTPPTVESQPRDSVRAFLERRFNEDLPESELSAMERAYKTFGLVPASMDLRRFMLDLLTEQVAGYYDPKAKTLYVVEGGDESLTDITISHELVHALQDQHFNLDSLTRAREDNDRLTTGQAVVEGQATLEQISIMIGSDNAITAMPGGWDRVRQLIRESQSSMPVFASAPTILQETLIFPYLSGAEFMRRFKTEAKGQSPFTRMPVSTEQLLHPERYFESRDDPTTVILPPPSSGRVAYQNNLGEFETRILLFEYLKDQGSAVRGAAGWDGDRYALIETPRGDAIAWVTVWDNSIDAAEFFDLLDVSMIKRHGGRITPAGSGTTRTYGASGRRILLQISDINGRPVVLYVDAPAGVSPRLLDLSKVRLQE
ncbi:MAG TPA: hypothetical protein VFZ73_00865 [Gemmatimonadaceae bacterium]